MTPTAGENPDFIAEIFFGPRPTSGRITDQILMTDGRIQAISPSGITLQVGAIGLPMATVETLRLVARALKREILGFRFDYPPGEPHSFELSP